MAVVHAKRIQILFISVLAIWLNLNIISGHQSPSHHHCDHSHHHHHDDHSVFTAEKLPEELAEEEDLRMFESASHYSRHQDHDNHHYGGASSELSGVGLWINAMGCSLLVCLASFICLIALPFIFIQGKPSKTIVDSLAIFGAGAMLGDAFLHQLPHAFGVEHAPSHSHLVDNAHHHAAHGHDHSHSHSLKDLSVGLSVLVGIVLFLLVEKVVRYVEDMSAGVNMWSHGHHHHHRKVDKTSKDVNQDDKQVDESSLIDKDGSISEMQSEEKVSQKLCDRSFIVEKQNESALRKRLTSTNAGENSIDEGAEDGPHDHTKFMTEKESIQSSSNLVFGYLNLFSDGVHNFSDGMALGSAFLLYGSVGGWSRTLFLLAHELPQEIGDFGILVRSGFSIPKALFFNFLSALVALAGTALALLWGQDPTQSSLIEGFTAGGFIYLAVAGVLAEVNSVTSGLKDTAIQLTSLIMGISVALFISLAE